ncbi:type II toxin-antitoxin system RelE/ParE family toxin [Lonepinella sp. BR2271]|uniref:type II toxin-antitoxin system RelE/ParE family toxin n=1 Tax=Lonepinella sp. BR2271 TaxID=3434550 RepID=UPI003F6DB56C
MPKDVIISKEANKDIDDILESIYQYTLFASTPQKLYDEFRRTFRLLGIAPKMGKLQPDGTRIIFCRHYRIIYQEVDDRVEILTVIHSRRLYPQPHTY